MNATKAVTYPVLLEKDLNVFETMQFKFLIDLGVDMAMS